MARGPLKPETVKERNLQKIKEQYEALGIPIPEAFIEQLREKPVEPEIDKVLEANSVLEYYFSNGKAFKDRECKHCGLVFAYSWEYDSIKYCSVECLRDALKAIGIKWDSSKPLADRYRFYYKSRPAVISPQALSVVKQAMEENGLQEDPTPDKSPEYLQQ